MAQRFSAMNLENNKSDIIEEIIKIRQSKGLTQKQLEKISGVRQPVIARTEKMATDPNLSTLVKILKSLDKKISIVDI